MTRTRRRLGARITKLREKKEWTQQKLADKAGVHQTYLCDLENGKRNCTIDVIDRVAEALGVAVADLF